MKALLFIGLLGLLAAVAAHDEDDFDDEAEIEDEMEALPADTVTVEKVVQRNQSCISCNVWRRL